MSDADAPPLLRLLTGWPVAVVDVGGEGRGLVASRPLRAGELVLASQPFGRVIYAPARRRWCAQCHGLSAGAALRRCCRASPDACGACYCSRRCADAAAPRHGATLCAARAMLRAGRHAQGAPPLHALDAECTTLALLLLDCAAQHAAQRRGEALAPASAEPGAPPAPAPQLADVLAMYAPDDDVAQRLGGWPAKWAACAAAVQAAVLAACGGDGSAAAAALGGLDAEQLASVASKDLSNSFGLWDRGGACADAPLRSGGHALFPAAALLNHSCVPSTYHEHVRTSYVDQNGGGGDQGCALLAVRALRDMAAGEALTIRYVDPSGGDAERAAAMTGTWGFACACARCAGDGPQAEAAVAAWDDAFLCVACGYPRPGAGRVAGGAQRGAAPVGGAAGGKRRGCACPQPHLLPPPRLPVPTPSAVPLRPPRQDGAQDGERERTILN